MALVGLAGLAGRPWVTAAAAVGGIAATFFWVLGQNIGELYSGQATDPNTGPLIVLMVLALAGKTGRARRATNKEQGSLLTGARPESGVLKLDWNLPRP